MRFRLFVPSVLAVLLLADPAFSKDPVVIELNQTPCVIVEAEKAPKQYDSKSYNDCARINKLTKGKRILRPLNLKPGKTIFRVTNKNVPYELGFWLRGQGLRRVTLPSVSGGGLHKGVTHDYVIDLEPGNYLYSCPLNPTPDYLLTVAE
jgi:hypothetical protein